VRTLSNQDRRVDVTLGIHLSGTDTRSDTDAIVRELSKHIGDLSVVTRHGVMAVYEVDDPIHVHNVQQGRRV
jgi:hypothetical protein